MTNFAKKVKGLLLAFILLFSVVFSFAIVGEVKGVYAAGNSYKEFVDAYNGSANGSTLTLSNNVVVNQDLVTNAGTGYESFDLNKDIAININFAADYKITSDYPMNIKDGSVTLKNGKYYGSINLYEGASLVIDSDFIVYGNINVIKTAASGDVANLTVAGKVECTDGTPIFVGDVDASANIITTGTVSSFDHPAITMYSGYLVVNGGIVKGSYGIVVCGGSASITAGSVQGIDGGQGLLVWTKTTTPSVAVSGTATISSIDSYAVLSKADEGKTRATGFIDKTPTAGPTLTSNKDFELADDLLKDQGDGKTYVFAKNGGNDEVKEAFVELYDGDTLLRCFATISEALAKAEPNNTIKLMKDITLSSGDYITIADELSVTLDLNGHNIDATAVNSSAVFILKENSALSVINSAADTDCTIKYAVKDVSLFFSTDATSTLNITGQEDHPINLEFVNDVASQSSTAIQTKGALNLNYVNMFVTGSAEFKPIQLFGDNANTNTVNIDNAVINGKVVDGVIDARFAGTLNIGQNSENNAAVVINNNIDYASAIIYAKTKNENTNATTINVYHATLGSVAYYDAISAAVSVTGSKVTLNIMNAKMYAKKDVNYDASVVNKTAYQYTEGNDIAIYKGTGTAEYIKDYQTSNIRFYTEGDWSTMRLTYVTVTIGSVTTYYYDAEAALAVANAATDAVTMKFLYDVKVTSTYVFNNASQTITVDLNGAKGTGITFTGDKVAAMQVVQGKVIFTGKGTITSDVADATSAVILVGDAAQTAATTLIVNDGINVTTATCNGIKVEGAISQLLTFNGKVSTTAPANANYAGCGIWVSSSSNATLILNSKAEVSSANANGIYLPNGLINTTDGAKVTGATALYIKGGVANISGGTFTATGAKVAYTYNATAGIPTGDAIVVENAGDAPIVTITDGTLVSANNNQVGFYHNGDYIAKATVKIADFTTNAEAKIKNDYYETLDNAIYDASANDTITLLKDLNCKNAYYFNKDLILDLNNHNMLVDGPLYDSLYDGGYDDAYLFNIDVAELTITGKGNIDCNGYYGGDYYNGAISITNGGKLTIDEEIVLNTKTYYGILFNGSGSLVVKGIVNDTLSGSITIAVLIGDCNVTLAQTAKVSSVDDGMAIDQETNAVLTIENGAEVNGNICIAEGTAIINGGTFTSANDNISVINYGGNPDVTINAGTFNYSDGKYLINLAGFNGKIAKATVALTPGSFATNAQARIGNVYYDTLENAIKEGNNKTIILVNDITTTYPFEIDGKLITIDLNEKTLTSSTTLFNVLSNELRIVGTGTIASTAAFDGSAVILAESSEEVQIKIAENVTISSETTTGIIASGTVSPLIYVDGTIHTTGKPAIEVIKGIIYLTGTADVKSDTNSGILFKGGSLINDATAKISGKNALYIEGGSITINDGNFTSTEDAIKVQNNGANPTVLVKGGTYNYPSGKYLIGLYEADGYVAKAEVKIANFDDGLSSKTNALVKEGKVYYATLTGALIEANAANADTTIEIAQYHVYTETYTVNNVNGKKVILDLNGNTIFTEDDFIDVKTAFELTNSVSSCPSIHSSKNVIVADSTADVTINAKNDITLYQNSNSTTIVNAGKLTLEVAANKYLNIINYYNSNIVNTGALVVNNPAGTLLVQSTASYAVEFNSTNSESSINGGLFMGANGAMKITAAPANFIKGGQFQTISSNKPAFDTTVKGILSRTADTNPIVHNGDNSMPNGLLCGTATYGTYTNLQQAFVALPGGGWYTLDNAVVSYEIDSNTYFCQTIKEGMDNVGDGETLTLYVDYESNEDLTVDYSKSFKFNLNGKTITSAYTLNVVQGTITMSNGTFKTASTGILVSNTGKLVLGADLTIEGTDVALVLEAGEATINGATLKGKNGIITQTKLTVNTATITATEDAIVLKNAGSDPEVTIVDCTFTSNENIKFEETKSILTATINLANDKFTTNAEAKIVDVYYNLLGKAIANSADGNTITLLNDISITKSYFLFTKKLTLDLNNHDITSDVYVIQVAKGELDITGTGTICSTSDTYCIGYLGSSNDSKLTIGENVTLKSEQSNGISIGGTGKAVLVVNGTIDTYDISIGQLTNCADTVLLTIGSTAKIKSSNNNAIECYYGSITIEDGAEISGKTALKLCGGNATINGGKFTSTTGAAVIISGENGADIAAQFLGVPTYVLPEGQKEVEFTNSDNATLSFFYPQAGTSALTTNAQVKSAATTVSSVNGNWYSADLYSGIQAASCGNTIELMNDVGSAETPYAKDLVIDKCLAINLNGHKIYSSMESALTITECANDSVAYVTIYNGEIINANGKGITVDGSSTNTVNACLGTYTQALTITAKDNALYVKGSNAEVTVYANLESTEGAAVATTSGDETPLLYFSAPAVITGATNALELTNAATVTIDDATFVGTTSAVSMKGGKVTVYKATFESQGEAFVIDSREELTDTFEIKFLVEPTFNVPAETLKITLYTADDNAAAGKFFYPAAIDSTFTNAQVKTDKTNVSGVDGWWYCADLQGAFDATECGKTITLVNDYGTAAAPHTKGFVVSKCLTIDLNGNTVYIDGDDAFTFNDCANHASTLLLTNGTVVATNGNAVVVDVNTCTVQLDCNINGTVDVQNGKLVLTACNILGELDNAGEVEVSGTAKLADVYNDGTFTFTAGTITGDFVNNATFIMNGGKFDNAALINEGNATINDGTFYCTVVNNNENGVMVVDNAKFTAKLRRNAINTSGDSYIVNNGDLTIESGTQINHLENVDGTLVINGGTFINDGNIPGVDSPAALLVSGGTLTINGGTFISKTGAAVIIDEFNSLCATGGTFVSYSATDDLKVILEDLPQIDYVLYEYKYNGSNEYNAYQICSVTDYATKASDPEVGKIVAGQLTSNLIGGVDVSVYPANMNFSKITVLYDFVESFFYYYENDLYETLPIRNNYIVVPNIDFFFTREADSSIPYITIGVTELKSYLWNLDNLYCTVLNEYQVYGDNGKSYFLQYLVSLLMEYELDDYNDDNADTTATMIKVVTAAFNTVLDLNSVEASVSETINFIYVQSEYAQRVNEKWSEMTALGYDLTADTTVNTLHDEFNDPTNEQNTYSYKTNADLINVYAMYIEAIDSYVASIETIRTNAIDEVKNYAQNNGLTLNASEYTALKQDNTEAGINEAMVAAKASIDELVAQKANLEKVVSDAQTAIASMVDMTNTKIADLKDAFASELGNSYSSIENKLSTTFDAVNANINDAKEAVTDAQTALIKANADTNTAIATKASELAQAIATVNENVNAAKQAVADAQTALTTAINDAIASLKAEADENAQDIADLSQAVTGYNASLAQAIETAQAKADEAKAAVQTAQVDTNSALDAMKAAINANTDAQASDLAQAIADTKAAVQAAKQAVADSQAALEAAINNALTAIEQDLDTKLATVQSLLNALASDVDVIKNDNYTAIVSAINAAKAEAVKAQEEVDAAKAAIVGILEADEDGLEDINDNVAAATEATEKAYASLNDALNLLKADTAENATISVENFKTVYIILAGLVVLVSFTLVIAILKRRH